MSAETAPPFGELARTLWYMTDDEWDEIVADARGETDA